MSERVVTSARPNGIRGRALTAAGATAARVAGQGCLYTKRLDDVDHDALRKLIDRSVRVRKGIDRAST